MHCSCENSPCSAAQRQQLIAYLNRTKVTINRSKVLAVGDDDCGDGLVSGSADTVHAERQQGIACLDALAFGDRAGEALAAQLYRVYTDMDEQLCAVVAGQANCVTHLCANGCVAGCDNLADRGLDGDTGTEHFLSEGLVAGLGERYGAVQ